jgi:hypothetical protein
LGEPGEVKVATLDESAWASRDRREDLGVALSADSTLDLILFRTRGAQQKIDGFTAVRSGSRYVACTLGSALYLCERHERRAKERGIKGGEKQRPCGALLC